MFTYRSGIVDFSVALQCLLDFANFAYVTPTVEFGVATVLLLSIVVN